MSPESRIKQEQPVNHVPEEAAPLDYFKIETSAERKLVEAIVINGLHARANPDETGRIFGKDVETPGTKGGLRSEVKITHLDHLDTKITSELYLTMVPPYYLEAEPTTDSKKLTQRDIVSSMYRWDILRRTGVYIKRDGMSPEDVGSVEGLSKDAHKTARMTRDKFQAIRELFTIRLEKLFEVEGVKGSDILITGLDNKGQKLSELPELIPNVQGVIIPETGSIIVDYIKPGGIEGSIKTNNLGWATGWDVRFDEDA